MAATQTRTKPSYIPSKLTLIARTVISRIGLRQDPKLEVDLKDAIHNHEVDITEYLSEALIRNDLIRKDLNQPIVTQRALQSFMLRKLKHWTPADD